jgi:adenine-specific DNA-methyltransferase
LPKNSTGDDSCWRWSKDKIIKEDTTSQTPVLIAKQKKNGDWNIYERARKSTTKAKSLWDDTSVISEQGTTGLGLLGLKNLFDHPKPLGLLNKSLQISSEYDDIILDFFSGSATTAHAVMQLNAEDGGKRKFIMVQIPETCDEKSEAFKAGYKTIADIGKERIRRAGQKIKADNPLTAMDLDIGFRVLKVDSSNMNEVYYSPDTLNREDLHQFVENIRNDRSDEDLLFQVLLDWGVDLTLPITSQVID